MKVRIGARVCSSRKEIWDTLSNPNDKAWFLPPRTKGLIWKKRKKVSQDFIDLMNGKSIKAMVFMKDWRFTYATMK